MPLEFNSESVVVSSPVATSVTTITQLIHEGETATYSVQLQGPGGAAIADTDFTAIQMTYLDEESRLVINQRIDQNVLNANNVTLSATALLTWSIQAADTAFIDPSETRTIEYHRAIFRFDFDIGSGPEIGYHEVRIPVRRAFAAAVPSFT
jgi:hypothetical protein